MTGLVYLWTVLAAVGLGVQSIRLVSTQRLISYSRKAGLPNGDRGRILRGHRRSQVVYATMHLIFLYIGLRVLIGFEFGALAWLFVGAQTLLVFAGIFNYRDERHFSRKE